MKTFHFDWDDNIMYMPTNIIIYHKTTKEPLFCSTEVFAHIREKVGTDMNLSFSVSNGHKNAVLSGDTINLQDYEFIYHDDFSFSEFRDTPTENKFLRDIKIAVANNSFAISFKDFQEAMSCPRTAKLTSIITARGNSPECMLEGLQYLKQLGLIENVPELEHLYPVSWDGFKSAGTADKPQDKKLMVIEQLIIKIEKLNPDAHFGFSDDDAKTINVLTEYLSKHPTSLKLHLYFTKNNVKSKVTLK